MWSCCYCFSLFDEKKMFSLAHFQISDYHQKKKTHQSPTCWRCSSTSHTRADRLGCNSFTTSFLPQPEFMSLEAKTTNLWFSVVASSVLSSFHVGLPSLSASTFSSTTQERKSRVYQAGIPETTFFQPSLKGSKKARQTTIQNVFGKSTPFQNKFPKKERDSWKSTRIKAHPVTKKKPGEDKITEA